MLCLLVVFSKLCCCCFFSCIYFWQYEGQNSSQHIEHCQEEQQRLHIPCDHFLKEREKERWHTCTASQTNQLVKVNDWAVSPDTDHGNRVGHMATSSMFKEKCCPYQHHYCQSPYQIHARQWQYDVGPALHCTIMLRVPCWYRQLTAEFSETYQVLQKISPTVSLGFWIIKHATIKFHIFDTIPFLLNVQEERDKEPWRNVLHFVAVNMTLITDSSQIKGKYQSTTKWKERI